VRCPDRRGTADDNHACDDADGNRGRPPTFFLQQLRETNMRRQLFIAAAFLGMAGLAQAQQATTGSTDALVEVENESLMIDQLNMTVDELDGMDIETPDGETVGEVESVLMTPDGEPVAVTSGVGGFLGMGQRTVVIQLQELQQQEDRLVTQLSREQIEALETRD
jgi:hypothetical protein